MATAECVILHRCLLCGEAYRSPEKAEACETKHRAERDLYNLLCARPDAHIGFIIFDKNNNPRAAYLNQEKTEWNKDTCLHSLDSTDRIGLSNFPANPIIQTLRESIIGHWQPFYSLQTKKAQQIWRETKHDLNLALLDLPCPEDCKKAGEELRQMLLKNNAQIIFRTKEGTRSINW